ncbi:hypothetical protein HZS_5611, partial [Henneguya salminicola]
MDNEINSKKDSDDKGYMQLNFDDPFSSVLALLEKKNRNLEKRKLKGLQLQKLLETGKKLNEDQKASASSIREVDSNLEFIKEISAAVVNMRNEFLLLSKKKQVKESSPVQNFHSTQPDILKQYIDCQNNLKRLSENAAKIKNKKSDSDKVLTPEEIDKLLAFWKLIFTTASSDPSSRLKKIAHHYSLFSKKDLKIINPDISLSYAEIHALYNKIGSTIYSVKVADSVASEANNSLNKQEVIAPGVIKVQETSAPEAELSDGWHEASGSNYDRRQKNRAFDPKAVSVSKEETKTFKANFAVKSSGPLIVVRDISGEYRGRGRGTYRGQNNGHFQHDRTRRYDITLNISCHQFLILSLLFIMRSSLIIATYLLILSLVECHSDHSHHSKHKSLHARDESRSKLHALKKKKASTKGDINNLPHQQTQEPASPVEPTIQPAATTGAKPQPPQVATQAAAPAGSPITTAPTTTASPSVVVYATTEEPEVMDSESSSGESLEVSTTTQAPTPTIKITPVNQNPEIIATSTSTTPVATTSATSSLPIPAGPSVSYSGPLPVENLPPITSVLPMQTFSPAEIANAITVSADAGMVKTSVAPQPPLYARGKTNNLAKKKEFLHNKHTGSKRKIHAKQASSRSTHHHSASNTLNHPKKVTSLLKKGVVTTHTLNRISQTPQASMTQHAKSDTSAVVRYSLHGCFFKKNRMLGRFQENRAARPPISVRDKDSKLVSLREPLSVLRTNKRQ